MPHHPKHRRMENSTIYLYNKTKDTYNAIGNPLTWYAGAAFTRQHGRQLAGYTDATPFRMYTPSMGFVSPTSEATLTSSHMFVALFDSLESFDFITTSAYATRI